LNSQEAQPLYVEDINSKEKIQHRTNTKEMAVALCILTIIIASQIIISPPAFYKNLIFRLVLMGLLLVLWTLFYLYWIGSHTLFKIYHDRIEDGQYKLQFSEMRRIIKISQGLKINYTIEPKKRWISRIMTLKYECDEGSPLCIALDILKKEFEDAPRSKSL